MQMLLQREVQMAVNIAKARDQLQWYGGLYTLVVSGIVAAKANGKPVPVFAAVPVVVGGFMLCNMADMGNLVPCTITFFSVRMIRRRVVLTINAHPLPCLSVRKQTWPCCQRSGKCFAVW